jgi:hypothetical protein
VVNNDWNLPFNVLDMENNVPYAKSGGTPCETRRQRRQHGELEVDQRASRSIFIAATARRGDAATKSETPPRLSPAKSHDHRLV